LHDLEQAGAFVVSLDARRSWFRYHQMFADLLELELRRTAPGEVTGLHAAAAGWFASHGYPVEAIRHAQAARDWGRAARLLSDRWVSLELDGQAATAQALLARAGARNGDRAHRAAARPGGAVRCAQPYRSARPRTARSTPHALLSRGLLRSWALAPAASRCSYALMTHTQRRL
jgi:hypothetical protein